MTSYLIDNDAAFNRPDPDLDAKLDKAFGTAESLVAQIAALGDVTWTAPRLQLQVGERRDYRVTGTAVTIHVYRLETDLYVVTVTDNGTTVRHYTQTWTPDRVPSGDAWQATWDYVQSIARDFGGSVTR